MKKSAKGLVLFLVILAIAILLFIWLSDSKWELLSTTTNKNIASLVVVTILFFLLLVREALLFSIESLARWAFRDKAGIKQTELKQEPIMSSLESLKRHLQFRHGWRWRHKQQWILVLGEPELAARVLPELETQGWQESRDAVLLWGGSTQAALDKTWLAALRKLRGTLYGTKIIDAQVWLVDSHTYAPGRAELAKQEKAIWQMFERNKSLSWSAPLYLLDVRDAVWHRTESDIPVAGVLFNRRDNEHQKITAVERLMKQNITPGMNRLVSDHQDRYLLQLTQDVERHDMARLHNWLAPFTQLQPEIVLRGLFFSPSLSAIATDNPHLFQPTPVWQQMIADSKQAKGQTIGFPLPKVLQLAVLSASLLFSSGTILSYINNQRLISQAEQAITQSQNQVAGSHEALLAQRDLQDQLSLLLYRSRTDVPWLYRFGLSQNEPLLAVLWPHYQRLNQTNLVQPLQQQLAKQLTVLLQTAPERRQQLQGENKVGYDTLKAYLMMATPARTEPDLLLRELMQPALRPDTISPGDWVALVPELTRFYVDNLSHFPDWAVTTDSSLVRDIRQILLHQMGTKNAETSLYQGILKRTAQNYPNLTLNQLLNGTEGRLLFISDDEIAGVFTRQAWEGMVEREINQAVNARRDEIDWVLSDGGSELSQSISPEQLKANLTERYFTDYAAVWLNFLNHIQWRNAGNLSDTIDQLALLSDARQSPLAALMTTLKYQGQAGIQKKAFADDIVQSAKVMLGKEEQLEAIPGLSAPVGPVYPLESTFGPLFKLLDSPDNSDSALSVASYLTRVTRVRLKLQQITSSPDPKGSTQLLARTVFQGRAVDLTDTRDYGSLIAASLGAEWSGFGNNLFVQPLEQAWQSVLEPAALSFNQNWRESVVNPWNQAFTGRYPFKKTNNDASLPELARFLRPDSGVIDRFIASELNGVLVKQGNRWVPNELNAQGLRFNPDFLAAINQLNDLSYQLFADGDAGMTFEIMAKGTRGVTKTDLQIDNFTFVYFNQREIWKTVKWPGDTDSPRASLLWSATDSGMQVYDDYRGNMSFIRLLERARVEALDSSRYQVSWYAEDGHHLRYIIRPGSGKGPLELLTLRNFALPERVFEDREFNHQPTDNGYGLAPNETQEPVTVQKVVKVTDKGQK